MGGVSPERHDCRVVTQRAEDDAHVPDAVGRADEVEGARGAETLWEVRGVEAHAEEVGGAHREHTWEI